MRSTLPDLLFPLSSTPGALPGEGQGRHANGLTEKLGDRIVRRRAPGLTSVVATGQTGPRGMIDVAGTLFVAFSGCVVTISPELVVTVLPGALPGTDGVTFARNNRVTDGVPTPDVVACRESGGAFLVSGGSVVAYPDADLPAAANSVDFLGGYFVFTIPDGRIFASELNSPAIEALSVATAESRPDGLARGIVFNGRYIAFGAETIEFWSNEGYQPFPFGRFPTVAQVGLLTTMAVAGFEEGWDRSPIFVAHDKTVRRLDGFDATSISTPDVHRFIAASTVSTLEASAHTVDGRAIWALSSDRGTWAYDLSTDTWCPRVSVGANRWRASRTAYSNGRWLVGDTLSGSILAIDAVAKTEVGQPIVWTIESAPLKQFPIQAAYSAVFGDFTLGLGDDVTPDPKVAISWSRDGGVTWKGPVFRSLGPASQKVRPVRVNGLGQASHHGLRVRFSISDPVDFAFMGATVPQPKGRAP